MFAIRNKKTGEFVYGTDYRTRRRRKDGSWSCSQRTSKNQALTFTWLDNAVADFRHRGISPDLYEVVKVEMIVKSVYKKKDIAEQLSLAFPAA